MAQRKNPGVIIDWDGVSARFELGEHLSNTDPLTKVDILSDVKNGVEDAYEAAFDELYPGARERTQRKVNFARRTAVESLVGQTITLALALRNGDVALQLGDGRVLVFTAPSEDVLVKPAESLVQAKAYADETCPHTWFVDEPTEADHAAANQTRSQELSAAYLGIARP